MGKWKAGELALFKKKSFEGFWRAENWEELSKIEMTMSNDMSSEKQIQTQFLYLVSWHLKE